MSPANEARLRAAMREGLAVVVDVATTPGDLNYVASAFVNPCQVTATICRVAGGRYAKSPNIQRDRLQAMSESVVALMHEVWASEADDQVYDLTESMPLPVPVTDGVTTITAADFTIRIPKRGTR